jgi:hypothetical protein
VGVDELGGELGGESAVRIGTTSLGACRQRAAESYVFLVELEWEQWEAPPATGTSIVV